MKNECPISCIIRENFSIMDLDYPNLSMMPRKYPPYCDACTKFCTKKDKLGCHTSQTEKLILVSREGLRRLKKNR